MLSFYLKAYDTQNNLLAELCNRDLFRDEFSHGMVKPLVLWAFELTPLSNYYYFDNTVSQYPMVLLEPAFGQIL